MGTMTKKKTELKDIHIRRLTNKSDVDGNPLTTRHMVGNPSGLHLLIKINGAKHWVLRKKIADKRRDIGLGAYPDISLKQARDLAKENIALIEQGIDPTIEKRRRKVALRKEQKQEITFAELAEEFKQTKTTEWKSLKQVRRLQQYLDDYVNPFIGHLAIKDIDRDHLIEMLKPIYHRINPTALRIINYVEEIIQLGIIRQLRNEDNPARWNKNLALAFPKSTKVHKVKHQRSVKYQLMPEFMPKLLAMAKTRPEAACLAFQILTVGRPGETRLVDWTEIDIAQKVWFVPNSDEELRKSDREWMIPLCSEAIKILKNQEPQKKGLVFHNNGNPIPDNYISCIPDALGYDGVAHGFRSTFETWEMELTDRQWSPDAVRLAMKHVDKDSTRAAYARGQCYPERIRLITAWEEWLFKGELHDNIIPIRRNAG